MNAHEFDKFWRGMVALRPKDSRLTGDRNVRAAWCAALEPYALEDASHALMDYCRSANGKLFPDIADVTGGLRMEQPVSDREDADISWMREWVLKRDGRVPA